jgi:hypothetical protein
MQVKRKKWKENRRLKGRGGVRHRMSVPETEDKHTPSSQNSNLGDV